MRKMKASERDAPPPAILDGNLQCTSGHFDAGKKKRGEMSDERASPFKTRPTSAKARKSKQKKIHIHNFFLLLACLPFHLSPVGPGEK
jgi:hypothetical protein